MNAIEKFGIPEGAIITSLKPGCAIMIHDTFFQSQRKVMRGLEQHLANMTMETEHDYISGTYVYVITPVDRTGSLVIKFDPVLVTFGSKYLY